MFANSGYQSKGFAPQCPYFQKQPPVVNDTFLPMCRIKETFEDGQTFIADSFEHGEWIDITEPRQCGHECLCNELGGAVEDRAGAFAFTVKKTPTTMEISLHDVDLRKVVMDTLTKPNQEPLFRESPCNGFLLLKHRSLLARRLRQMQRCHNDHFRSNYKAAVLSLLLNGVLDDPLIFKSYGFLWLHDRGYLELDEWEWFYGYGAISQRRETSVGTEKDLDETTTRVFTALVNEPSSDYDDENQSGPSALRELIRNYTSIEGYYELYEPWLSTKISRMETGLIGPEPEVARGQPLYDAVKHQDFVRVQNLLQSCNGAYERGGPGLANHHQAGQTQDGAQIDAQILLLATRMNCIRSTKLLLSHGYDVNSQFAGETTLSVAAVRGSDSLVRLLLRYGAEVSVATLILQSKSSASVKRINVLSQAHVFQIAQKKLKYNQNLIRLRNNFWKEHALMSEMTRLSHLTDNPAITGTDVLPPPSYFVEKNVRLAWSTSVATMRDLCNGNPPRNAQSLLLFLALVKSMAPIICQNTAHDIESEFFADITRWQLLVCHDEQEHTKFKSAVRTIWNIDVTQSRLKPFEDELLFSHEIVQIQDLTNRLVDQVYKSFQLTDVNELCLPNVQARWQARRAASILRHPEELANQGMQDMEISTKNSHNSLHIEGATEPWPGRFIEEIFQSSKGTSTSNDILAIVLAGSIFAIILAFLLLLRNSEYHSIIKTLFPLATTLTRNEDGITTIYDPMHMVRRTRRLLDLYHESNLPTVGIPTTNSQKGITQQTTRDAEKSTFNDPGQQSPPETIIICEGMSLAPDISSPQSKCPPVAQTEGKLCDECNSIFSTSTNLNRHKREQHEGIRFSCKQPGCGKTYKRDDIRRMHERTAHGVDSPSSTNGTIV